LFCTQPSLIKTKRDIILVDQRGTGGSNPLQCSQQTDPESNQDPVDDDDYLNSIKDCVSALDANLKLYTTAIAMDDLDEVRQVLGYEKINIYGASTGSRRSNYLRQYPDRVPTIWTVSFLLAGRGHLAADAQKHQI
jgi:pimeloyl-ACP methyl ester carboxylesterase